MGGWGRVEVPHQVGLTAGQRGGRGSSGQGLLKLLLLFPVFGAPVLKPDLLDEVRLGLTVIIHCCFFQSNLNE